eukprot:scaffold11721_cov63-Phaeocystis_antarctica.AAC.4
MARPFIRRPTPSPAKKTTPKTQLSGSCSVLSGQPDSRGGGAGLAGAWPSGANPNPCVAARLWLSGAWLAAAWLSAWLSA